jgi:hypothetical protein
MFQNQSSHQLTRDQRARLHHAFDEVARFITEEYPASRIDGVDVECVAWYLLDQVEGCRRRSQHPYDYFASLPKTILDPEARATLGATTKEAP